jgi:aspartate racemase
VLSIRPVGGTSWESSLVYCKLLDLGVEQRFGGLHSARTVISSAKLHEVTELQQPGRWDEVATVRAGVIDELGDAGTQGVILGCTELELLVERADCELPGVSEHHAGRGGRSGPRARGVISTSSINRSGARSTGLEHALGE